MEYIELVKNAKKGDSKSFSKLIKLCEKDMYRVAKAIMGNDDDALDCIQDAVLRAFKGIRNLSNEEYFNTWIIKILINCCNNLISDRRKITSYIDSSSREAEIEDVKIDKIEIDEALQKLDEEMKLPIILFYFEDMSICDIAESLRIPEGTVKSRLSRARVKLKQLLDYKERGVI